MRVLVSILVFIAWLTPAIAQDDQDRGFVAGLLEDALGGEGRIVRVEGFAGALRATATIDRVTIADADGVWLEIEEAALTWNRSALLRGSVDIEKMTAKRIALTRLPLAQPSQTPTAAAPGFSLPDLPVSIKVSELGSDLIEIGAPILGEDLALSLNVAATLSDGELDAALSAARVDGKTGRFDLSAAFLNETQNLTLNLDASEGAGGLISRLLNIPDAPSIALQVAGEGPLTDFAADMALRSDGQDRLAGQVILQEPEDALGTRRFNVDLGGDLTALFAPQYRSFFGPNVKLRAIGSRDIDGAIDLEAFELATLAMQLRGAVALSADAWPLAFDVSGRMETQDGAPVLLPVSGGDTRVDSIVFELSHDADVSDAWQGVLDVRGFSNGGQNLRRAILEGSGTIDANPGQIGSATALLELALVGVDLGDSALNSALGDRVTGQIGIGYADEQPIDLHTIQLNGNTYALSGKAVLDGLDAAFASSFDLALYSRDISQLSGLIGQDVAGAVNLGLVGTADAGGAFDLTLTGTANGLTSGIDAADQILSDRSELDVHVARSETGFDLHHARVATDHALIEARGQIGETSGQIEFDLSLDDVSRVAPDFPGAAQVSGQLDRLDAETWQVDVNGTGPFRTAFTANGAVAPALDLDFDLALPDVGPLAPGFSGPLQARGALRNLAGPTEVELSAQGPAGTTANLSGTLSPQIDVRLDGNAPLGLANRFIAPRNVQGSASFQLRQQGTDMSGLSGDIQISNATAVEPAQNLVFENVGGTVRLARNRAQIALSADPQRGGRVGVNGSVLLSGGNSADLTISLNGVQLEDPDLYRTQLGGQVLVRGPLQNGAQVSGRIDVGETLITIASASVGSLGALPDIRHIGASGGVATTQRRAGLEAQSTQAGSGGPVYPLDLTITAPARVFVRGRGLDAEVRGALRLTGTTARLISSGGFELVRGRFDILSQRFDLDEGRVALVGDLDPFLKFVATTDTSSGTASVILEGRASDPEVRFESSPTLPQEEVLAQLIFGRDLSSLSAFQALQLANAVATLAGRKGVSLLGRLREGFALDDLDVTTDSSGNTNVRAGKYISDNVYTDVILGNGDEAGVSINIDLTPNVTVRGAATQGTGTSLGIFYERDY